MAKLLTVKNRFKNHSVKPTSSAQATADEVCLEVIEQAIVKSDANWKAKWSEYNQYLHPIMDSEGKPTGNFEDDESVILLMHVMDITDAMYDSLADLNFITVLED